MESSLKNEHRIHQRRTVSIERPTSNDEWEKEKKQAYDLEEKQGWVEKRNPTKDRLTQPTNEPWPVLEPSPISLLLKIY